MPDDPLQVPPGLTTDGLVGRRYLARLIDLMVLVILTVASLRLSGVWPDLPWKRASPTVVLIINVAIFAVWIGYGTLLEFSPWQATIGKRLMGLKVYDTEGGRLKLRHSARRTAIKEVPFELLPLIPGGRLLSFGWLIAHLVVLHRSPVYQAIHDRVAKTLVAAPEATTQLHLT